MALLLKSTLFDAQKSQIDNAQIEGFDADTKFFVRAGTWAFSPAQRLARPDIHLAFCTETYGRVHFQGEVSKHIWVNFTIKSLSIKKIHKAKLISFA